MSKTYWYSVAENLLSLATIVALVGGLMIIGYALQVKVTREIVRQELAEVEK